MYIVRPDPLFSVNGGGSRSTAATYLLAAFSSRRSTSQSLIIDWRVTPMRLASLSSESITQEGKSTLIRFCFWFGRLALDKSRSSIMSCLLKFHLFFTGAPDGNYSDGITTISYYG